MVTGLPVTLMQDSTGLDKKRTKKEQELNKEEAAVSEIRISPRTGPDFLRRFQPPQSSDASMTYSLRGSLAHRVVLLSQISAKLLSAVSIQTPSFIALFAIQLLNRFENSALQICTS